MEELVKFAERIIAIPYMRSEIEIGKKGLVIYITNDLFGREREYRIKLGLSTETYTEMLDMIYEDAVMAFCNM